MKGNSKMEEELQKITGHTVAKIHEDFQRDFYLSSAEAVQYGIIDKVLLPREKTRQDIYASRGVRGRHIFGGVPWRGQGCDDSKFSRPDFGSSIARKNGYVCSVVLRI